MSSSQRIMLEQLVCLCTMHLLENPWQRRRCCRKRRRRRIFFIFSRRIRQYCIIWGHVIFSKNFPLRGGLSNFYVEFYLLRLNPNLRLSKFVKGLHNKAVTSPLKRNQLNSVLFLYETTTLEILMQKHMIFLWQPWTSDVYRV